MARRPSWRLAAVVLVALLAVTLVAALRDDGDDGVERLGEDEAPGAFLNAWRRSRAATFVTVADFTRRSNSTGAELTRRVVSAQRPPDHLRVDDLGATGLVDGRRLTCGYRNDRLRCQEAEAQRSYEEEVEAELAGFRQYLGGDDPLYSAVGELGTADGDCYELRLERRTVAPPLGIVSRYCFDPETDVPTLTHVESVEAVDDLRTVEQRAEVTDADFDPATYDG